MVNQSLTSQTYWLIDHSKPLWPVNEFVPNLDKKYEISPIFQLEIVSKIKILTMSAIMPAQNLKSKCPFGIYVAKWFTNSLGVSDYSVSRNEIFDRSIDQSTSQLSKLTGQPSVKSNAPSPRPMYEYPTHTWFNELSGYSENELGTLTCSAIRTKTFVYVNVCM